MVVHSLNHCNPLIIKYLPAALYLFLLHPFSHDLIATVRVMHTDFICLVMPERIVRHERRILDAKLLQVLGDTMDILVGIGDSWYKRRSRQECYLRAR